MKTQKRVQKSKTSSANVRRVQELRRSNATTPVPSGTKYNRNTKYGITWEDDDDDENDIYLWR